MTGRVALGADEFSLVGAPPALGAVVPVAGAGVRVLYVAPSLERWPRAAAATFADAARRTGLAPNLLACSADHDPIRDVWSAQAGWEAIRFDQAMIKALGLWIPTLSLPARALLVVDGSSRLHLRSVAARLEEEVAFADGLRALETLA